MIANVVRNAPIRKNQKNSENSNMPIKIAIMLPMQPFAPEIIKNNAAEEHDVQSLSFKLPTTIIAIVMQTTIDSVTGDPIK